GAPLGGVVAWCRIFTHSAVGTLKRLGAALLAWLGAACISEPCVGDRRRPDLAAEPATDRSETDRLSLLTEWWRVVEASDIVTATVSGLCPPRFAELVARVDGYNGQIIAGRDGGRIGAVLTQEELVAAVKQVHTSFPGSELLA